MLNSIKWYFVPLAFFAAAWVVVYFFFKSGELDFTMHCMSIPGFWVTIGWIFARLWYDKRLADRDKQITDARRTISYQYEQERRTEAKWKQDIAQARLESEFSVVFSTPPETPPAEAEEFYFTVPGIPSQDLRRLFEAIATQDNLTAPDFSARRLFDYEILTRRQCDALRDAMLEAGLLELRDPSAPNKGTQATEPCKALLQEIRDRSQAHANPGLPKAQNPATIPETFGGE